MKASKYNFLTRTKKGDIIGYNSITGALAKIDDEHYHEYQLIKKGESHLSKLKGKRKKDILENLEKGNFIYNNEEYEEYDALSTSYNINKYFTNHLNLTIAPTMECNFNCYYCYEKKGGIRQTVMIKKTEKAIVDFVENMLKEKSRLSVTWYGGEPLLEKEIIYRLSTEFSRICTQKKCDFITSIVTNGYYFDKDTVDTLIKYNLSEVQITIDGPREEHNKRRYDKKEGPSFDRIIENIIYAKEFTRIAIRANIDKNNIEKIDELINFFMQNKITGNVTMYPGRVSDCNLDFKNLSNLLLSSDEFYEKEKEIFLRAINEDIKLMGHAYPHPVVIPCGAVNFNTFSIDPDGYVYKCWEVMGVEEEAIFHISNPNLFSKKHLEWINWDPKSISECKSCQHLPICNGGCVLHAIKGNKTCSYWKHHLDDMLEILAYKYERNKKEQGKCSKV